MSRQESVSFPEEAAPVLVTMICTQNHVTKMNTMVADDLAPNTDRA